MRSLAKLSEAVYTPGGTQKNSRRPESSVAKHTLRLLLEQLAVPPLAYVPLCRSSSPFRPVLRIPPRESSVFVTRARASALLCVEVERDTCAGRALDPASPTSADAGGTARPTRVACLAITALKQSSHDRAPRPPGM